MPWRAQSRCRVRLPRCRSRWRHHRRCGFAKSAGTDGDAITIRERAEVTRPVARPRHLKDSHRAAGPVPARRVQGVERVSRPFRCVEGPRAALHSGDAVRAGAPVGVGCPGPPRACEAGRGLRRGLAACGTLVDGCGGLRVSSPRIPSIWGATEASTSGAPRCRTRSCPRTGGTSRSASRRRTGPGPQFRRPAAPDRSPKAPRPSGPPEGWTYLRDRARRWAELLGKLLRRQEVVVLGRPGSDTRCPPPPTPR